MAFGLCTRLHSFSAKQKSSIQGIPCKACCRPLCVFSPNLVIGCVGCGPKGGVHQLLQQFSPPHIMCTSFGTLM